MFNPEKINAAKKRSTNEVRRWLKDHFSLHYGSDAQVTFVIRRDEQIIATASRAGNVFKYFGICRDCQGENLSGILLDALIDEAFQSGIYHYFIFTSPENSRFFEGAGFNEVITNPYAALLEGGRGSIKEYMASLQKDLGGPSGRRGAIVMNLNPMTLGHLYLIEEARKQTDELIVFLVEEDLSVFPLKARLRIAEEATAHLPGVKVVPGGPYMISRATFPTYFLKRSDADLPAYTTTDAGIFGKYYAQALDISCRFAGEEPLDPVTAAYNKVLGEELNKYGVAFHVLARKQMGGSVISASRVRRHLAKGETLEALQLVPEATRRFLVSEEGGRVIEEIRQKEGRQDEV